MQSFALTSIRLTAVHLFLILLALGGLSSAQKKSWPTLDNSRTLSVSTENDLVIARDVHTGEVVSVEPADPRAPGTPPPPTYTFQTLAAPSGACSAYAQGINSNGTQIVGEYSPYENGPSCYASDGLLYSGSQMTVLTYPGAVYTSVNGINDKGVAVGNGAAVESPSTGFVYENGQYKAIPSEGQDADPTGISDSNAIVGIFIPNNEVSYHSLLLSKGVHTKIIFPGSPTSTYVGGVNQSGEVVGTYQIPNTGSNFGFTDVNGTYTSFQVPGASYVDNAAISNNGNIAGSYQDSNGNYHGYVLIDGVFTYPIDYPGATNTQVYGIDDAGDIVGSYYQGPCTLSGKYPYCAFVATVQ